MYATADLRDKVHNNVIN